MPTSILADRRRLAWRIERFLRAQGYGPAPAKITGWQADQTFMAIEKLGAGEFADGEYLMMKVERPDLWEPVGYLAAAQHDARQLLDRLLRVMGQ